MELTTISLWGDYSEFYYSFDQYIRFEDDLSWKEGPYSEDVIKAIGKPQIESYEDWVLYELYWSVYASLQPSVPQVSGDINDDSIPF